jgi:hypothetical protein
MGPQATEISGIEHLILLDLLGAENPLIRSYTIDTAWLFDALVSVEKRLGESGAFAYGDEQGMAPEKWSSFFYKRTAVDVNMGGIGDDHVPFLERGVDILHLIATPFPVVWHTVRVSTIHRPSVFNHLLLTTTTRRTMRLPSTCRPCDVGISCSVSSCPNI